MILRRALAEDAATLAGMLTDALTARLFIPGNLSGFDAAMMRTWIAAAPPMPFTVAVDGADIVGLQMVIGDYDAEDEDTEGEIFTLLRGWIFFDDFGAEMFAATRAACKEAGFRSLTAKVADHDRAAAAYYPALGFEQCGVNVNMACLNGWRVGQTLWRLELGDA